MKSRNCSRIAGLISLWLSSIICLAQKQANLWYLSDSIGLDFSSGSPQIFKGNAMHTLEGTATISDSKGQLLFYSDGVSVWDRLNQVMPNGKELKGHWSSTQSALIVPKPGSTGSYFLFTSDQSGYVPALQHSNIHYSEVNMCLHNGFGDIEPKTKNRFLHSNSAEKLAATRHRNGVDYWLMTRDLLGNNFYAHRVTHQGVDSVAVISPLGRNETWRTNDPGVGIGYMKFSPNGKRLAIIYNHEGEVEVYDFDAASGKLSNPILVSPGTIAVPYGLEFSLDNTKLYIAGVTNLVQFDLQGSPYEILASRTDTMVVGFFMALQLAPNGKIYITQESYNYPEKAKYLGVIEQPNLPLSQAGFVEKGLYLGKTLYQSGLPNFVSSLFDRRPTIDYQRNCETGNVFLQVEATEPVASVQWNLGDSLASDNASVGMNTSHRYAKPGLYTVSAQVQLTSGRVDTVYTQVHVPLTSPVVLNDTLLCQGEILELDLGSLEGSIRWSDGLEEPRRSFNRAGTYWVEICYGSCSVRDSFQLTYLSPAILDLGRDTTFCYQSSVLLDATVPYGTYRWNNASQDAHLTVTESGTYWVTVQTPCSRVSDTIRVVFEAAPVVSLGRDTTLCTSQVLTLDAFSPQAVSYRWNTGSTSSQLVVSESGWYWVEAKGKSCSTQDSIEVIFEECWVDLTIPNIITPNEDQQNQYFYIEGLTTHWQLEIFNRWGNRVYQTSGYHNEWEATGQSNGLYYYQLRNQVTGQQYKGWIQVLR